MRLRGVIARVIDLLTSSRESNHFKDLHYNSLQNCPLKTSVHFVCVCVCVMIRVLESHNKNLYFYEKAEMVTMKANCLCVSSLCKLQWLFN